MFIMDGAAVKLRGKIGKKREYFAIVLLANSSYHSNLMNSNVMKLVMCQGTCGGRKMKRRRMRKGRR
jgi:hypothetical protein